MFRVLIVSEKSIGARLDISLIDISLYSDTFKVNAQVMRMTAHNAEAFVLGTIEEKVKDREHLPILSHTLAHMIYE